MARALIFSNGDGKKIGEFEFDHLPREDEDLAIPSASGEYGVLYLTVREVTHIATAAPTQWGEDGERVVGPCTVLRCDVIG